MRLDDHVFPIPVFGRRDRILLYPRFEKEMPAPISQRYDGRFLHKEPIGGGVELQAMGLISDTPRGLQQLLRVRMAVVYIEVDA